MVRMLNGMLAVGFGWGFSSIGWADDFSVAVEKVLMQQKEITNLDADRQRKMVTCVNGVLADVPDPTKAALIHRLSPHLHLDRSTTARERQRILSDDEDRSGRP